MLKADNDKDIYLVFDHMDTDLFNARKILKPPHLPYIMYGADDLGLFDLPAFLDHAVRRVTCSVSLVSSMLIGCMPSDAVLDARLQVPAHCSHQLHALRWRHSP